MKKWTRFAIVAVAAIAFTAAPALAGNRVRVQSRHGYGHGYGHGQGHGYGHGYGHGIGWSNSYPSRHHANRYVPAHHPRVLHGPVYHGPGYHGPVYHAPVYVPAYRSVNHHGFHGPRSLRSGGVGIHAGGLGIHIGF